MSEVDEAIKLENQLCFPLYACSKEIVKRYKPFLDEIDLTYTQYIAMMVLWENDGMSAKELGKKLFLDSGTLTPVLKKLEKKGYISRGRSEEDERTLLLEITDKGNELKEKAARIPEKMSGFIRLSQEEAQSLYIILYKILDNLQ
mgnify:CR=1 FL=1